MSEAVVKISDDMPDEHLYGRAGYISTLMFVQSHLGHDVFHPDITRKVQYPLSHWVVPIR